MRDDLAIAGMIRRFHGDDAIADFRFMATKIFDKFGLRQRRANDQDLGRIADSIHYLPQKLDVRRRVAAADRGGFVIKLPRWQLRMQHHLVLAQEPDVKDASLGMVDPNDRVEVGGHAHVLI